MSRTSNASKHKAYESRMKLPRTAIALALALVAIVWGLRSIHLDTMGWRSIFGMPRLASSTATSPDNTSTSKMNILILYADDWRFDTLGMASNGTVWTPFLDQFATQAVRFTHNYVTTSICWVSRASFYTGQYLSRHKSNLPKYPRFYQNWSNQSFPGLLHAHNYYTGHIGKWQFWNFNQDLRSHYGFARLYEGKHWFSNPDGTRIHTIDRNEQDALEFLKERPRDRPFALTVAFFPPHAVDGTREQYFPQNKTFSLYQNITLSPPNHPNMSESWKKLPRQIFDERNEGRNRWHLRFDNPHKYQHMLKNYYRLVSGVDDTCQRIVQELKRQGIYDNTLIVFTADNGLYHGEKGLAGKWYAHQESIRIPLIIRDPRMPRSWRNTTLDDMTLNIDLAPTILGAAGIPAPNTMQGQDLSQIYLDPNGAPPEWRRDFYYEHPQINGGDNNQSIIPESTGVVRKDMKYISWTADSSTNYHHPQIEQLFDLTHDPKEEDDRAARPDYFHVLQAMRARHDELKESVK